MTRQGNRTPGLAVGAYVALTLGPILDAAAHAWFWQHAHDMAPVAAGCGIALLVALIYRRRWAWLLLASLDVFEVVSIPFSSDMSILWGACSLAAFALIVSPPMRAYVRGEPVRA